MKNFTKWIFSILFIFLSNSVFTNTEYLYVVNSDIKTVDVLDIATGLIVQTYTGFNSPFGVVVNSAGTKAYVTNSNEGTYLDVIDTQSHAVSQLPILGGSLGSPQFMAISLDGNVGYVIDGAGSRIIFVNLNNGNIIQITTGLNGLVGIALNSEGTYGYVTTTGDNSLYVVRLSIPYNYTKVELEDPSLLTCPEGIVIKDNIAYVVNGNSTCGVISTIDLRQSPSPINNNLSTGNYYHQTGNSISMNGKTIYVSNQTGGIFSILTDPIDFFPDKVDLCTPNGIAVNENTAYVVNSSANNVSIFDLESGIEIYTILSDYFNKPSSIALSIDKHYAYVTNTGDSSLAVIDLASASYAVTLFTFIGRALDTPKGIIISNVSGSPLAYICNCGELNTVAVVDISGITSGFMITPFTAIFNNPISIALNSNGSKAVVINGDTTSYSILDLITSDSETYTIDPSGVASSLPVPGGVVLSSDETKAYTVYNSNSIAVINLSNQTIINIFSSAHLNTPNGFALNSDHSCAYITNNDGNLAKVTFPPEPLGINVPAGLRINSNDTKAYVAFGWAPDFSLSGNYGLAIIDLNTGKINTIKSLNFSFPSSVGLNNLDNVAYVTNYDSGISEVNLSNNTVSSLAFTSRLIQIRDIAMDPSFPRVGYVVSETNTNNVHVVDFNAQTVSLLHMDHPEFILNPTAIVILGSTLYVGISPAPHAFGLCRISDIYSAEAKVTTISLSPTVTFSSQITGIFPSSDGNNFYVVSSSFPNSIIYKVDSSITSVIDSVTVNGLVYGIGLDSLRTKGYLTYSSTGRIGVYNLSPPSNSHNFGFSAPKGIFNSN